MKGELKAGGLALVVFAYDRSDIGKCVTLVKLMQPGETFNAPDGTYSKWAGEFPVWLVTGDLFAGGMSDFRKCYGWAMFRPKSLMPIDESDPDAVDQRECDLVAD